MNFDVNRYLEAWRRFGFLGLARSAGQHGLTHTVRMILYELTRPVLMAVATALIQRMSPSGEAAVVGHDAWVFPQTGLIVSLDGGPRIGIGHSEARVARTLIKTIFDLQYLRLLREMFGPTETYQQPIAVVSNPHRSNYYHFLLQTLPYLLSDRPACHHLLNETQYEMLLEASELFDMDISNIGGTARQIVFAETVVIREEAPLGERVAALRGSRVAVEPADVARVSIGRTDAVERRIANDEALGGLLDAYGFVEVDPAHHPMRYNISVFAGADVIVGPHGAGLSDIVFAERAQVIELHGHRLDTVYGTIAEAVGSRYARLRCDQVGPDLHVDIDALESLLSEYVKQEPQDD
jgi:hypothetical protein